MQTTGKSIMMPKILPSNENKSIKRTRPKNNKKIFNNLKLHNNNNKKTPYKTNLKRFKQKTQTKNTHKRIYMTKSIQMDL